MKNRPKRRLCSWLMLAVLATLSAYPARADITQDIEGNKLSGRLVIKGGTATLTDVDGKTHTMALLDLDQAGFGEHLVLVKQASQLLINNDGRQAAPGRKTASIKLRAGMHRLVVPYWQAAEGYQLALSVSGPGINGEALVAGERLRSFRNSEEKHEPSAGIDLKGFRLPEMPLDEAKNIRRFLQRANYRLYVGDESMPFGDMGVFQKLQFKRGGTTSAINTGVITEPSTYLGIIFEGFFVAEQDGEYTFALTSDDGAQLYFGDVKRFQAGALGGAPVEAPWLAELAFGGTARGEISQIQDERCTLKLPNAGGVTLDLSHLRAVWDTDADPGQINRDNEPEGEDTVYIRDKNDPGKILPVSGRVTGMDSESLSFDFRGKGRTIARGRVAGVVFAHASRPAPPNPGFHQLVQLQGGHLLPCKVESVDAEATLAVIGGGTITVPRDALRAMRFENGRRVDLTRVEPTAEESIPFFGLKFPHRVNTSFAGGPIKLYDDTVYSRGLAVHSKSRLHYRLDRPCERFRAQFGLLNPGGKLGDVTARVLGDGEVLWEQAGITANSGVVRVDVGLEGVERLVLEVDFGQGQDVGDRAAWCNPELIFEAQ